VRREHPGRTVEVEADTVEQLEQALAAGADVVLLDNMAPEMLRHAVRITNGRAQLEASGGITIETIREVAETGVNAISVGALTHSVRALDIAMEVTPSAP
jgi:nicotinate-nucleotide pyrophosphorylase (carboxylating)